MPSKKNARGRGRPVQKRQKEERPEREFIEKERGIADRETDVPSPSSSSSVDFVPETVLEVITVTQKELSSEEEPTVQPKKRIRVSKKEIPEYQWTDEGTRKLSEYVKDHPMLFDKRQKDWLNVAAKSQLWKQTGEQQEPPATGKVRYTPTFSGHRKIVHDFTCLLEGHMLAIPEDSWHDFEIVCLNLVQRFRQRGQATQQQQQHQQQPQSWQSPQQQVWQSSQQQQHPQAWQQPSHTWQFSQSSQAPQQQSPPWPQWTGTIGWDQGGPAAPSSTPVPVPSPSGQSVTATRQSSVSQSPVFKTPVTPIALTPGSGDSSLEGLSALLRTTNMDTPPILRVSPDSSGASSSKDTE